MTREEEIRQAGIEYTCKNRPMCIGGDAFSKVIDGMNRNHDFEEGAKWADEHSNIVEYLIEKGYPVSTGGDIPTYEQSMQVMTELYNHQKNNWMETACKWLEKEVAELTGTDSEALKEAFIEVMGS